MVSNRCAVCLLCLASLVALSTQDLYTNRKRAELLQETFLPDHHFTNRNVRQSKFWSGSRYGRAGHDMPQPRLEVEPRGDRFFMGSRYGKRSTWPGKAVQTHTVVHIPGIEPESLVLNLNGQAGEMPMIHQSEGLDSLLDEHLKQTETEDGSVQESVTCLYTGIVNIFRCTKFNRQITRKDSEEDDAN